MSFEVVDEETRAYDYSWYGDRKRPATRLALSFSCLHIEDWGLKHQVSKGKHSVEKTPRK